MVLLIFNTLSISPIPNCNSWRTGTFRWVWGSLVVVVGGCVSPLGARIALPLLDMVVM